jgi:hypothetical protein
MIVVRREPRLAFRLTEDALNYSYLGERLRPTAAENFPLLLRDLSQKATSAFITPSTRVLLANGEHDASSATFASSQALLDDALIRLLWSWYKHDRDEDLKRRLGE